MAFEGSEKEAKLAHDEFVVQVKRGQVADRNISLEKFIEVYKSIHFEKLAPKTKVDYKTQLDKRIVPLLGKYKLSELSPLVITRFYQELAKRQTGDCTLRKNHRLLSAILSEAVYLQYLDSNPCKKMKAPSYHRKSNDNYFNTEELQDFLDVLEESPLKWQVACLIPVLAGARASEVAGLQWKNVDLKNKKIRIEEIRQRVQGEGVITKMPKTKGSSRVIPIPNLLCEKLKALKLERRNYRRRMLAKKGHTYVESDYVITNEDGTPVAPYSPSQYFSRLIERKGLKKITYHGLRHTYATLLHHSNKIPDFALSENLGHSDPTTYQRIYTHEISDSNRLAADYFDENFPRMRKIK